MFGLSTHGMEEVGLKVNGQAIEGTTYVIDGVALRSDTAGGISNNKTQVTGPDAIYALKPVSQR